MVYCSDEACVASGAAYQLLVNRGCKNARRSAGAMSDWGDAGYPLEGEMVDKQAVSIPTHLPDH
jgi:rhodanese-related sulfurtransferase